MLIYVMKVSHKLYISLSWCPISIHYVSIMNAVVWHLIISMLFSYQEVEKLKALYHKEKLEKGIQMYPDVEKNKQVIANNIFQEVKHAMQEERMKQAGQHNTRGSW